MNDGGWSCDMDPLIKNLVGDAATPPEVAPIVGYLGGNPADGRCRIHLDITLDYFDFNTEDIVHVERLDEPFGGSTVVWLKDTAELERSSGHADASEDEFLNGDLADMARGHARFVSRSASGRSDSRLWLWDRRKRIWRCRRRA